MIKDPTNDKEVKQALIKELNLFGNHKLLCAAFDLFNDKTLISPEDIKATKRHTYTLLELKRLELMQHVDYYYKKYSKAETGHLEEQYREKYIECMNELADVLDLIHTLQEKNRLEVLDKLERLLYGD